SFKLNNITKSFIDVKFVDNQNILKKSEFKDSLKAPSDAFFVNSTEDFYCEREDSVKMSKSKYNVVNPDQIVEKYGADTLRMYEMFLGPLELPKPWDT